MRSVMLKVLSQMPKLTFVLDSLFNIMAWKLSGLTIISFSLNHKTCKFEFLFQSVNQDSKLFGSFGEIEYLFLDVVG